MEQKLAEFRARKRAAAAANSCEATESQAKAQPGSVAQPPGSASAPINPDTPDQPEKTAIYTDSAQAGPDWLMDSAVGRWLGLRCLAMTNLTVLKLLLWLVLLGLFSELDFGLPFFLISLFYWLYAGLRSPGARQPGELSAYSVFNPDCQPLLGTLTAQQLEGELGYRPLANR
ncbi:SAYSvFN domain-containing protein 1 [Megalops cyprinoides]|uniref:SAYSvFN domain-containing protein 1 n=1 Tax=Megalops cyprinoides TaxID=118141 RepID=UPI0018647D4C|nr:SAYSvFN domain-containing protein 1 [Megalops cyprinoides]